MFQIIKKIFGNLILTIALIFVSVVLLAFFTGGLEKLLFFIPAEKNIYDQQADEWISLRQKVSLILGVILLIITASAAFSISSKTKSVQKKAKKCPPEDY